MKLFLARGSLAARRALVEKSGLGLAAKTLIPMNKTGNYPRRYPQVVHQLAHKI